LARVYLYTEDWANAETEATSLIDHSALFQLEDLNNVFLKNSREAIWQLQPVNQGWNTEDARAYIIPSTGFGYFNPLYLSDQLLNSFEANDQRKTEWVGKFTDATVTSNVDYYYPFKYKSVTLNAPVTEYSAIFRLAEQYLIRAEARTHLNNIGGAQDDLNTIRSRAGLPNTTAGDAVSLLSAILHERHVELFTEWGHRWLDLKRTGTVDSVMSVVTPLKGGTWNLNWKLYPIPLEEINRDPNLVQNPGYE
jgi:hypothetical protein